jgi:hypothetical protein
MGEVWLGRDREVPSTLVALKTIREDVGLGPKGRAMFFDEARIARQVVHRNVGLVVDVGEHEGVPYLALEWIDGCSLRALLPDDEVLPVAIALRIIADACAGLHAAHELRSDDGRLLELVHRDVSPQNVMLSRAGVTKLIDFGVAKARQRLAGDTSTGGLKGKVRYMSPEQALSRTVDRRSDVFSLGALLFRMLVGRAPFDDDSDLVVLRELLRLAPVPIPEIVPEPVAAVLRRALAPKPEGRYATALELRDAIESALALLGIPAGEADVARHVEPYLPHVAQAPIAPAATPRAPSGDLDKRREAPPFGVVGAEPQDFTGTRTIVTPPPFPARGGWRRRVAAFAVATIAALSILFVSRTASIGSEAATPPSHAATTPVPEVVQTLWPTPSPTPSDGPAIAAGPDSASAPAPSPASAPAPSREAPKRPRANERRKGHDNGDLASALRDRR